MPNLSGGWGVGSVGRWHSWREGISGRRRVWRALPFLCFAKIGAKQGKEAAVPN